jgi:hypothetical protein
MTGSTFQTGTLTSAQPSPVSAPRAARIIPGFFRNCCPACRSENLLIKALIPTEKLMIFLTGKRKYRCKDCGTGFRMMDRRHLQREREAMLGALPRVS